MSILVYVCLRRPDSAAQVTQSLRSLAKRLTPDNIAVPTPKILGSGGIIVGVFNPNETIHFADRGVCAGYLVQSADWAEPLSGRPDGAYALFRGNNDHVELLSDSLASRTIWHFKNEEIFIASTSQRAIVALAGSFSFNPKVVAWMLSSGMLGPQHGWDSRIHPLEGGASFVLDRRSWQVSITTEPVNFAPLEASDEEHAARITQALQSAISHAKFNSTQWVFPLSGGIDCRTLLCLINDKARLRTVTWGIRASLRQRNSDACVARDLAQRLGLENTFHQIDRSTEPVGDVFDRFLRAGEGRIDHVSGYMDGFQVWKTLHDGGVQGIIRGDEAFGRDGVAEGPPTLRSAAVRIAAMPVWSDFADLPPLAQFGIPAQEIPERLLWRDNESSETWRDRLQHQFRFPVVLSALNDLKLPYVEVAAPLLANSIVTEIRKLPDHLRTNKTLLRRIAQQLNPPVRVARYPATDLATDILKSAPVVAFLKDELAAIRKESTVPSDLLDSVLDKIVHAGAQERRSTIWRNLKRTFAAYIPERPKGVTPNSLPGRPPIDFNRMAFRIMLISRMQIILNEDAATLRVS